MRRKWENKLKREMEMMCEEMDEEGKDRKKNVGRASGERKKRSRTKTSGIRKG